MNSRLAIAHVVGTLNPGGTEKLVVEMSKALSAHYDVTVICLDEPGEWADDLRGAGIPVHVAWRQPGFDLALPRRLARYFRSAKVRVVHAHQCTPWFYAALARLWFPSFKLLLHEHGRFFPEPDKPLRRLVNRLFIERLTHRFVAVSQDVRLRLHRYEGLDARKIDVIYNGVDRPPPSDVFDRPRLRQELGLDPDAFVVGTVGRLDPIKNLPMLVDALAEAARSIPQIMGLIVGDGPELGRVRERVAALGQQDRIRFAGYRKDARRVLSCLDMFVLSSLSEGTSVALLEAMAAGVPVAVTAVGGNTEVVDAETGWLVDSGDARGLAAAMIECCENAAKRQSLAARAKQRFAERYSFDTMLEAYRHQYREMLDSGGNVT